MSDRITHASVFSGIGASELAAEMLGWKNLFHCEINEFGRKVLNYHFPNARSYEDVTTTDFSEWRGKVTVLTGGFPCQPWELPTDETEFLSSHTDLLKAPTAFDAELTTGKKNPKAGNSGCLAQEVMSGYVKKRMPGLLPTPTAQDNPHPTNKIDENGRRWTEGAKASHSMGLADMAYMGLLPTPQASEGEKFANKYKPNSQMGRSLSAMAGGGLLPTPRANVVTDLNLNSEDLANRNHANLEERIAACVCRLKTDGDIFRLNPLFTEEMMGFPLMWTALPFLSQNGKKKH